MQSQTHAKIQPDPITFVANMAKVAEHAQAVWQKVASQPRDFSNASADPFNLSAAFMTMASHLMADPSKLAEKHMHLWSDYLQLWQRSTQRLLGEDKQPFVEADSKDRRFKDEAWQQNPVFDFIKQSYLLTARWLQDTVQDVPGMDPKAARKLEFYTRQFTDAMAPSNFAMTNPEVLRATIETNGENLVKGLEHLLKDVETGRIRMTDTKAFEIGKNLAVTPGKVVFQNDLMQLIQYTPTTPRVDQVPLLIIPPWINKYYILDLQPENSFVRWLVEQGHTVFMISWVNPDATLGRKTFDDYLLEGPIAALDAIEKATGESQVEVIGYCLGGTLLSITLAYLRAKKQKRIICATYLTTLVDFAESGELSIFVDEEQLQALEKRMSEKGYLEGQAMAVTFNMLRANDLIWSNAINNYLLGKDPFPFDLLYWNSDSTRMPAAMHSFYLRNMYQKNLLVKPKGITVAGVPIDITQLDVPTYIISTREDHIAPWRSTYAATQLYKGDVRFVLAASGHIAGIVNPPDKKKYSHWVNDKLPASPDVWFSKAKEHPGSWWSDWQRWQKPFSGKKVDARKPGSGKLKPIENAPGTYVKTRS